MSTKIVNPSDRIVAILIEDLRLWILSQPHLNSRLDDEFLHGFLRACQFDLREAKSRLDTYYTLKNVIPSVLANRNINKQLIEMCQTGVSVFLPMFDKGVGLHFSKYPSSAYKNLHKYTEALKVFFMLAEINLLESRNLESPSAIAYIIDLKEATFKQSLKINFGLSHRISHLIQHGLPLKIYEVHFINVSIYFQCLMRIMCSFLSSDIKKKIYLHTSMDSFYKHIPKDFLPFEYGGKNGSITTCIKRQTENLMHYEKYFQDDDKYGVNEALRRRKM